MNPVQRLDEGRILESLALGVFAVDTDWNVTYFSREAERITGFSRGEVMGRKCWEIFHTEHCNHRCFLNQAVGENGRVVKRRVCLLTRDNRRVPLEITASTILDEQGRVVGGVECFTDVLAPPLDLEGGPGPPRGVVARDPAMLSVLETLRAVAATDAPVLLTGETGSGKGLLARTLHDCSARAAGPFIAVNCAALPEKLMESELFGYRRGAFTDARRDKAGRFELARDGTLFLDEIAELSPPLQAKLLQAIEERSFYPLGATRPVSVNARILSATNLHLEQRMQTGQFRPDLYYRLRVLELRVPPLRCRPADIIPLAEHFLKAAAERHQRPATRLSNAAKKRLAAYAFPGNARELRNIMEQAAVLAPGPRVEADVLPDIVPDMPHAVVSGERPDSPREARGASLTERERDAVLAALEENGWAMQQTADALGINRTTLWRRMKKYGI